MNRKLKQLLLVCCVLLATGTGKLYASHYAAIDLYVTYIGDANGCVGSSEMKYEVTIEVYASCPSGLPANGQPLRIWSENAGYDETFTTDAAIEDTVDELCPFYSNINSCKQPGNLQYPGYLMNTYKYIWTAPSQQADWKFSYSAFARSNFIDNLPNPGSLSIYVECCLNNLVKVYNSTPRFKESPLPYICQNQPAFYLNGPLDPNGDSMMISTTEPFDGPNVPIPYIAPLSTADPIDSDPANPYKMNPFTGTATFTPKNQGVYVLAFRCDEYERKTGAKLGYILRDVAVTIFQCNTPPPPVDDEPQNIVGGKMLPFGNSKALFTCLGNTLTFNVSAKSADPNAQVYLQTNIGDGMDPTASFAVTNDGTPNPTGTFGWTPATSNIGEHTLIITAKDSTCTGGGFALVLKNYQVVLIKVVQGLDAGPDLPICQINTQKRQLFVRGADDITIKWTDITGGPAKDLTADNIPNPVANPLSTTSYVVKTDDLVAPCANIDTVTVFIDTSNALDLFPQNPLILCKPDYLQLDAILTGKGPISNMSCGLNNKFTNPECLVPDTIAIYGSPIYGRLAFDSLGNSVPKFYNTVKSSKFQFLISRKDLREARLNSSTIKSINFETVKTGDATHQYANFRIGMKCTDKENLYSNTGFESNVTNVYNSTAPITFPDGKHQFVLDFPYNWDTTKNLLIEICYSNNPTFYKGSCTNPSTPEPPVLKYAPTTYNAMLSYFPVNYDFSAPGEVIPDSGALNVCGTLTSPTFNNISQQQMRPVFGFTYCDAPDAPFPIAWTPGTLLSDSTILQPLAYVPKSTKYVLETFGKSGCLLRDSVDIYIPVHDFSVWPKDSAICLGETAPMEVRNGFKAIWHEYVNGEYKSAEQSLSCTDCLSPIAKPKVTTTYKVEVADSVWCFDTLEVTVKVLPLPEVQILTRDTIVKYGQPLQLQVKGARTYNWMPPSSLNNANISYPIATPTEPTDYIVGGIGSNGCRSYDTVRVGIDYRNNLTIPTGFTPNGDGKNDMFRIANMTFQRVMEFRVFNRWGQEVFTGNSNTGWDGKWKGAPQDIGNYQYLIRLGYPDGHVETYKGEVTLIK